MNEYVCITMLSPDGRLTTHTLVPLKERPAFKPWDTIVIEREWEINHYEYELLQFLDEIQAALAIYPTDSNVARRNQVLACLSVFIELRLSAEKEGYNLSDPINLPSDPIEPPPSVPEHQCVFIDSLHCHICGASAF